MTRIAPAALAVLMTCLPAIARGEGIVVSAAVSLQEALTDAAEQYRRQTGRAVSLNFGATGHLFAQVRDGAPVDAIVSASMVQMDEAERAELIDPASRTVVAGNQLVLVVSSDSRTDIADFDSLSDAKVRRLAIGQPRTVPAGQYAEQALTRLGLIGPLRDRIVFASSVRQVLDYVARGEVDAGIVYATDARQAGDKVRVVATADPRTHDRVDYVFGVVSASRNKPEAGGFRDFLLSDRGQAAFAAHGFIPPPVGGNPVETVATTTPSSGAAPHGSAPRLSPPMLLSLKVALDATLLVAVIGIPLAFFMGRRRFFGKSVLDAMLVLPLVLPPTVVGYLILIVLGSRGPAGTLLRSTFGHSVLFHWHGAVIAAVVVSMPLLYLPAKAAFAGVDRELEDLARLFGANALQQFWHVSLPLARRGIASGLLLAFARALGEFGATVMVLGDLEGRRTLPISIYNDYVSGDLAAAWPGVVALTAISLGVIVFYNRSIRGGGGGGRIDG